MSVLDTLRAATPARRTVTMCVDGALQAEWDRTLAELDDVRPDEGSLAQPAVTAIADRLDALRDKVQASEVTFNFEKIPWTERLALQAAHPPRDGNMADRIRGLNADTFYPALIRASVVSVTGADGEEVTEVPDDVWDGLLGTSEAAGSLNSGQVNTLVTAAEAVNNGQTLVPPSARSLLESQDSGASLAQPSPGTSPRDDSADGSRPTSPTSSGGKKGRTKAGSGAS